MCNTLLKELELYKDCGGYFLKATYIVENETATEEIRIPRIRFDVNSHYLNFISMLGGVQLIDMGLTNTDLIIDCGRDEKTGECVKIIREVIEEKTKEMTLAEIEKKLGHKVKIVSGGKKNG